LIWRPRSLAIPAVSLLAIAVWLTLPASPASPPSDTSSPMRNEDVVRMLVAGESSAQVIEAIRSRDVDFDLSDEMLDELRLAGVPDAVIGAMRERQDELDRSREEETLLAEEAPPPGDEAPSLIVSLPPAPWTEESEEPIRALFFPSSLDENAAGAFQLGEREEDRRVTGLAIYLACITPEHVPDHWRSKSSMGRDFVSMPRHRLLAFHPGGSELEYADLPRPIRKRLNAAFPTVRKGSLRYLQLDLPESLEASVDRQVPHHILLGTAIQVGGRYLGLASVDRENVVPGEEGARLVARILYSNETQDLFRLGVELLEDPAQ
jgi:hypothetical protein